MTAQASVSLSWVNTVLSGAERYGLARARVLAHAALDAQRLRDERWPIDHITRLWRAAAELSGDAGFGLKVGSLVGPASFNVVGYIFQSSSTLREALSLVQKFQRLISDGGRFQLMAGAHSSWLLYHPQQGELAFSPHQIEAVLAAVVSFSRWVSEQAIVPTRVQFSHLRQGPLAGYQAVFHSDVDFGQAFSGLHLDNQLLDRTLPQADTQLAALHREYAAARLAALSVLVQTPDFQAQVRHWLATQLAHAVPERAAAAGHFGLSDRVFARRLQRQGWTYSALVDGVRQAAACDAVAHTQRPFTDIAQDLGFSEASAFNRAFKRWTDSSPSAWRSRHPPGTPAAP